MIVIFSIQLFIVSHLEPGLVLRIEDVDSSLLLGTVGGNVFEAFVFVEPSLEHGAETAVVKHVRPFYPLLKVR